MDNKIESVKNQDRNVSRSLKLPQKFNLVPFLSGSTCFVVVFLSLQLLNFFHNAVIYVELDWWKNWMRKTYHLGDNEKGFSFLWGPWDLSQVWWYKEFFQLEKTIFNSNFAKQTRSFWAFFYSAPYKNEIIMFFLLFFYFQISKKNKNYRKKIMTNFNFFLLVFLSLKMISFLIYFLVPVMYPLKHFYGNWDENNKEIIKKIIDEAHISGPTNALPSLHLISTTAAAMLFTGFIFSKKETNRLTYWTTKVICFFFWSAVTFLLFATVILKRHYLIDGITGILMTIFLWKWL